MKTYNFELEKSPQKQTIKKNKVFTEINPLSRLTSHARLKLPFQLIHTVSSRSSSLETNTQMKKCVREHIRWDST